MASKKLSSDTAIKTASSVGYAYDLSDIRVSASAQAFILSQINEPGALPCMGVRVYLKTTGCSGKSYQIDPVRVPVSGDFVFGAPPLVVFAPAADMPYLTGLFIDLQNDKFGQSLKFDNPNEQGRCGCGQSFTTNGPAPGSSQTTDPGVQE